MKLVYLGRVNCFLTDAASIRVYNVGEALRAEGHTVDYICQEGTCPDGKLTRDGSTYYGVFDDNTGKISMWLEWFFGRLAVGRLKTLLKKERYDGVILYNASALTAKKVLKFCRNHEIAVIGDVTEWYEIHPAKNLAASVFAWLVDRRIRFLDPKFDGIIAISPYLENYYKDKVPTITVPPVFLEDPIPNTSRNSRPRFFYAGSPSKKDELYNFLAAVKEINRDSVRVEMTLIGAPIPEDSESLKQKGIHYCPRMSREEVLAALREHDFTVLLRREARYAKAGYSTKVAEALYTGTPVFCNAIGGADEDVKDGVNGIKIGSYDTNTVKEALLRITEMSEEEIRTMKKESFAYGEKKYSRRNYEKKLSQFFISLTKCNVGELSQ